MLTLYFLYIQIQYLHRELLSRIIISFPDLRCIYIVYIKDYRYFLLLHATIYIFTINSCILYIIIVHEYCHITLT
jgi:hypothetical protein